MKHISCLIFFFILGVFVIPNTPKGDVYAATAAHCGTALDCVATDDPAGCVCSGDPAICQCGVTSNDNTPYCIPGDPNSGYQTSFGCISTNVAATSGENTFFYSALRVSIALAGGIALLLMLYGTFIVTTSAGLPDKLTLGKDIITSAITGLLFIILSVVIFNFIGIKILALPGLV